ncbi:DM13 domain-containing protein [Candidatus Peribacteria bacterium]|nr:MAG: DM13 domain-containing protein [Candidatus Peribacteria bacterium]
MKHARTLLLIAPLFLAACGTTQTGGSNTLDENLGNPLFAQRYYTDLAEHMVSLQLREDPIMKDAGKKAVIDRTRANAAEKAQDAIDLNAKGQKGYFISERDLSLGSVTLVNGMLYFSPDFISTPGPSLHVYLSDVTDPRQGEFPDASAVDLGLLKNIIGAQSFALPEKAADSYRTVVLWDDDLGIVHGFVQLD